MATQIHHTALISQGAKIGFNVKIGPFTSISDNVEIGEGTVIDGYCEIGYSTPRSQGRALLIGPHSQIRSHSVIYEGSTFGSELITGHRVTVREGVSAGKNLQIGTLSDIQGDCLIGDYVRFHSGVFVSKHSQIGSFVWLFPHVVLTEDPHPPSNFLVGVILEDFAAIAAGSILLPGVRIGKQSLVGAGSVVATNVDPGMVVIGVPAKPICKASEIKLKDGTDRPAYPWTTHFHRGYPESVVKTWLDSIHAHSRFGTSSP